MLLVSDGLWKRLLGGDAAGIGRQMCGQGDDRDRRDASRRAVSIGRTGRRLDAPLQRSRSRRSTWGTSTSSRAYAVGSRSRALSLRSVVRRRRSSASSLTPSAGARRSTHPREWLSGTQPVVLIAFGAVAFVLLTACAKMPPSLLLARASGRRREIAIRAALGATRWRVARQFLIESVLLAIAGGVAAVLLATWIIRALPGVLPPRLIAFSVYDAELDWRVLAFSLAASVVVGALSGVLPALRGFRASLTAIACRGRNSRHGHAGTPPGAQRPDRDPGRAGRCAAHRSRADDDELRRSGFIRTWLRRRRTRCGVRRAACREDQGPGSAAGVPLRVDRDRPCRAWGVKAVTLGTPPPRESAGRFVAERVERSGGAALLTAGPNYFAVLGIPLLAGRAFNAEDSAGFDAGRHRGRHGGRTLLAW